MKIRTSRTASLAVSTAGALALVGLSVIAFGPGQPRDSRCEIFCATVGHELAAAREGAVCRCLDASSDQIVAQTETE